MSELALYNPSQTSQVSTIKNALESPMVNLTSDADLYDKILPIYTACHVDLKQNLPDDPKDTTYIIKKIITNLRRHQRNIRIDEIELAFSNGIHGKYGKWFGLSVVTFCMFISEYCKDIDRIEALERRNKVPPTKKQPSDREIFRLCKKNALKAFILIQKENTTGRFGSLVFDFFYNIKLFLISQEEINEVYEAAKNQHLMELKSRKQIASDPLKKREIDNQISEYIDRVKDGKDAGAAVWSTAKKIYIDNFFDTAIKFEETTIKDLINMINSQYQHFVSHQNDVRKKEAEINKKINEAKKQDS